MHTRVSTLNSTLQARHTPGRLLPGNNEHGLSHGLDSKTLRTYFNCQGHVYFDAFRGECQAHTRTTVSSQGIPEDVQTDRLTLTGWRHTSAWGVILTTRSGSPSSHDGVTTRPRAEGEAERTLDCTPSVSHSARAALIFYYFFLKTLKPRHEKKRDSERS